MVPDLRSATRDADAQEFHQLLTESRGLYPGKLSPEDRAKFDLAIDEITVVSRKLAASIEVNDDGAAREALQQLAILRLRAHTKFSY